jgi:TolB-like protein
MKLRVFVQLVPEGTDTALWSGEYSAGRSDVLNMQAEPAKGGDSTCPLSPTKDR